MAALATLCLRQNFVNLVDNGVAFGLKANCGIAQQRSKNKAQAHQCKQGSEEGVLCNKFVHACLHQSRKAHKCQRHQSGGNHSDCGPLERRGDIGNGESLAHGSEQHQH